MAHQVDHQGAAGLYEYDAVSRLRDSQLGDERVKDIRNYIKRGKLWDAFVADERPVLLIDEVDKADIEFPNDLLLELDRMEFFVYETAETVKARRRPIVIITSNNEKELPDAFLRRCFFHYIRRFSVAGNDEPTTGTGGRRPKSAKARNRGMWGTVVPRRYGDLAAAVGLDDFGRSV